MGRLNWTFENVGVGVGRMPAETAMAESRAAAAVPRPRRRLAVGHLP
jgi:hypothetical protein